MAVPRPSGLRAATGGFAYGGGGSWIAAVPTAPVGSMTEVILDDRWLAVVRKLTAQRKRVGSLDIYRCSRYWDVGSIDTTGAIDSEGSMDLDFVVTKYVNQGTWRAERSFV